MISPEPRLGSDMLIACWHCSLCLMPIKIAEGLHSLSCSRCALVTQVKVTRKGEAWRIASGPSK